MKRSFRLCLVLVLVVGPAGSGCGHRYSSSTSAPANRSSAAAESERHEGGVIRGPTGAREIALVFTGHNYGEGVETILAALANHDAKASFFLTGDFLANPEFQPLVRRLVRAGHYLGPHSDKHLLYCSWEAAKPLLVNRAEFRADLLNNLRKAEGYGLPRAQVRYFLPAYEHYNRQIAEWTAELGLTLINLTPGTRSAADYTGESDTNFVSSQAIFDSVLATERKDPHGLNGYILLFHAGSGPQRADKFHPRLGELLDALAARGYRFVRVDHLLAGAAGPDAAAMERIKVAAEGKGFITAQTRRPFVPWGMNYGNAGRLMEDFWDKDWATLAGDFRELKELGANVVRVHLQFGKFMTGPDQPNRHALKQLARLLKLAEETGLYLDITGLACYRPADTPAWYDALDETSRWTAQANFWAAVAATCKGSSSVFCYDLINEPLSPGGPRKPGEWRSGSLFGGYDFLQFIALDPAGRKREDIAAAWIDRMTRAIRRHDEATLITVGLLPWSRQWHHLSGFLPEVVGPKLDFLSVHIYPDPKKPGEEMECLRQFAVDRPVVIEETFPLSCSPAELETFLRASRRYACGWVGHYDGQPIADLEALQKAGKLTLPQAIYLSWLQLFVRLKPEFAP